MLKTIFWILLCLVLAYIGAFFYSGYKVQKAQLRTPAKGVFVKTDQGQLHVLDQGSGPALIFLHGAGGHSRDFTFSLTQNFPNNRVLVFDRPGHGYSDPINPNGLPLDDQAAVIINAAKKLGVSQAIVVGYSFGGSVALGMALKDPEFVKAVVTISSPTMPWPSGKVDWTNEVAALPIFGPIAATFLNALGTDAFFKERYGGIFKPQSPPEGFLDHVDVTMSLNPTVFVQNSRQLVRFHDDLTQQSKMYSQLDLPIEMIHGTQDHSVYHADHLSRFSVLVPSANITKINGMGHGAHILGEPEIKAALARLGVK